MSDPLAARWRPEFPIVDTCTYLVSHSLGAMPRRAVDSVQAFAESWMTRGVRAWSEGWWEMGRTVGDMLAPIIGAPPGSISMHQNASVAQAIIGSCFRYDGPRRRIVMSALEFPTNIYVFGGFRRYGAEIVLVEAEDGIRTDLQRLLDAIDERTLLVPLSLVLFRSSYIQDARAVIDKAHQVGAHVILDIYQAAGVIPIDLPALGADFAVGGSVKWLCGGPGAGYLYVRPDLGAHPRTGLHRLGRARRSLFIRSRGHPICRSARALSERHAQRAGALCRARRLRDRRRHRRRRDPREVAAA